MSLSLLCPLSITDGVRLADCQTPSIFRTNWLTAYNSCPHSTDMEDMLVVHDWIGFIDSHLHTIGNLWKTEYTHHQIRIYKVNGEVRLQAKKYASDITTNVEVSGENIDVVTTHSHFGPANGARLFKTIPEGDPEWLNYDNDWDREERDKLLGHFDSDWEDALMKEFFTKPPVVNSHYDEYLRLFGLFDDNDILFPVDSFRWPKKKCSGVD